MADRHTPWAERTVEVPPQRTAPGAADADQPTAPGADQPTAPGVAGLFRRGVAQVGRGGPPPTAEFTAPHEPTGTGWPSEAGPGWSDGRIRPPRPPLSQQLAQLRRGGEWSVLGGLFAFVCWGVWAISARGNLASPVLTFVLTMLVGAGLFALCRVIGRVVLERQLGRVRHGARVSHMVTGAYLIVVGFAYLRQTEWVVSVWNWFAGWF
ncbi:hypothetical protein [Solwaraspora sp. WMMD792]|uniref:hypothetical protein n=1 Tax=Solwaraspora sp. WMMD792 TaxID=3016099 RepID=UPI0024174586|nr:hypothetical protein [Solwaraspora sp. WMMD792]MDG4772545.1 hypothetical protein [Solwaraspora sp. WMMD792]